MKASSPSAFEISPGYTQEILDYIRSNPFEVAEAYKNIAKALQASPEGQIRHVQDAYNRVYGSRRAKFELIAALEYLHSKITHEKLSLDQALKQAGVEKVEALHPAIARTTEVTHSKITKAAPDISKEFVDAVNRNND